MSPRDYRTQKMTRNEARKLLAKIMGEKLHDVVFSKHARNELRRDNLTTVDAINILKSPATQIPRDGEFENGSYRYQLATDRICLVVAFESATKLIVVTGWRKKQ